MAHRKHQDAPQAEPQTDAPVAASGLSARKEAERRRLADALRANLRRRKAQARARIDLDQQASD